MSVEVKSTSRLKAMLIAADKDNLLVLSGTGEVIDPDSGVCAIGSGGNYALAAARALAAGQTASEAFSALAGSSEDFSYAEGLLPVLRVLPRPFSA